jgi:galactose mutarotase-like enzyme
MLDNPNPVRKKNEIECYHSEFKGVASVVLENASLRAEWLPEYGAKLASLKLKSSCNQELLYQSPQQRLTIPPYQAKFGDFDTSGFDECFPSIDACQIRVERSGETVSMPVPCHGEVWALAWRYKVVERNTIEFSVTSPQLGYRLTKRATLLDNELRFSYRVELIGDIDRLPFLWTPHALFNYDAQTELVIPKRLDRVKSVCPAGRLNNQALTYTYPSTDQSAIGHWNCAKFLAQDEGTCDKFYFDDTLHTDDRFGFRTGDCEVLMSVDSDTAPYLGVWKNQGANNGTHNFALEPCSGIYDSARDAQSNGSVAYVTKAQPRSWSLNFQFESFEPC